MTLTEAEILTLLKNLHTFSPEEQEEIEQIADDVGRTLGLTVHLFEQGV